MKEGERAVRTAPAKRVLAIDTDRAFLTAVRRVVESGSCRVDLAHNAAEARGCIRRHHYHLVISELCMPQLDGVALFARLGKAMRKGTRLLFVSSTRPSPEMRSFLEERHLSYLDKPVHLRRFLDKLDDLLREEEEEP